MQFAIILTTSLSILLTHAIPMPNPDTKAASLLARANVADTGPDTSSIYRTGSTGSTTDIQDPDHITPGSSLQQAQAGSTPEEKEKTTYKNGKPFVAATNRGGGDYEICAKRDVEGAGWVRRALATVVGESVYEKRTC